MANKLNTVFKFDDADGKKIDVLRGKLVDFNAFANNLGRTELGKNINESFELAGKGAEKLGKDIDSLKTKTETFQPRPTISRYYENEANEVKKSVDQIKASTASVSSPSSLTRNNPGKLSFDRLTGRATTPTSSNPLIDGAKLYGESRFNEPAVFRKISEEAEKANLSVGKLRRGTTEFQRTLLELTDDFVPRGFNRPFNAVGREVFSQFNASGGAAPIQTAGGVEKIQALIRVKEAGLAVTRAEAAVTAASALASTGDATAKTLLVRASASATAARSAEAAATTALTAATNASTVSTIGFNTATLATVAPFAALAAVGIGIVKVTQNIREEAERRLKVEEGITGAINRQRISQKEALEDLKNAERDAQSARLFARELETGSVDDLKTKRDTVKRLAEMTPKTLPVLENGKVVSQPNETFQKLSQQLDSLNAQIIQTGANKQAIANEAFNQGFINFQKSQESQIESEKRLEIAAKKRAEDVEKGKEKVVELGKLYTETFDSLSVRVNSSNPFTSIFAEGDKAIRDLRENLKGLKPELQAIALQMQQKLNADSLFNARLENDFAGFDLKERANELRSFKQPTIDDPEKFFNDFIEAGLKQIGAGLGGGTRFNLTGDGVTSTQGFSQSRERRGVRYNSNIFTDGVNADGTPRQFTNGFSQSVEDPLTRYNSNIFTDANGKQFTGGFSQSRRTFADLTEREKSDFINKDNLPLQEKLSRQFTLAGNRNALNDEQQAMVDRKIISLSSGLRPEQLTGQQRELVATANEKEADRKASAEKEEIADRKQLLTYHKAIAENLEALKKIAEKDGLKGIENTLRVITGDGIEAELKPAATAKDTKKAYDDAYKGGTFYEQAEKSK